MTLLLIVVVAGGAAAAICGDADGDGAVSTSDGVRILRTAAGLDEACPASCDVDVDGTVSVTDGVLALRRAAGLPIVDRCGPGTIAGRLLVPPASAAPTRAEEEPNDGPGTATAVGRLTQGTTYHLTGAVDADDPFDGWVLVAPGAVTLDLALTFTDAPGTDLDLLVDDRRGGALCCERVGGGSETCRVTLGSSGAQAFDVVVAPAAGSQGSSYRLDVGVGRSDARSDLVPGAGASAPLDLDAAVYRGETPEIVPGEVLLRLTAGGRARAPHGSGAVPYAALAQTVAAAAIVDDLTVEATAPDGTTLLVLPALVAAAAGDDGATGAEVKHMRASARARTRAIAATLAVTPGVAAAAPHRVVRAARVPRDPLFGRQWAAEVIGLPRAWDVTIGTPSAIVAVVDTGIRSDHPDLAGRLVPGFDFIANPTRANDGDGLDSEPFDPGDRPRSPERGTFHGTHVAGTIAAATDNPAGVAGVTWRTAIMPLRTLGVGGGTIFDVAQAVRYAAGLPNVSETVPPTPARIINLSLTTTGDDPFLRGAVDDAAAAGALVVAAAGNTRRDFFVSPAGYPNVLSVTATDRLGSLARYSSFGPNVDLAAPGGDTRRDRDDDGEPDGILSTLDPGVRDYVLMQGTSMASAQVSGAAALLLGLPGGASATLLRETLLATTRDRGAPGRDDRYGAGLLDVAHAVRLRAGLPDPAAPALVPETTTLRIAADESTLVVPLHNAGGGSLVMSAPEVTTEDDGDWLTATLEPGGLRIAVDRDRLGPGEVRGRVRLPSSGGTAEIAVVAEVSAGPPEDIGPVTVHLRDAETRAIVAITVTDAAHSYRYGLDDIPPGRYQVVAGTDRDGDEIPCEVGDQCGAYPERTAPATIELFGGAGVGARDFALDLIVSTSDPLP